MNDRQKKKYQELVEYIKENFPGGRIRSGESYSHNQIKMCFIDSSGNEFFTTPNSVKNGHWSPFEARGGVCDPDYQIKQLQKIAKSRGGKLKAGQVYTNWQTKLWFTDSSENDFQATPNSIRNGRWSPYECRSVRDPAYHMRELDKIVKAHGGKIKDGETYRGFRAKITIIDAAGMEFQITPGDLKNGHWYSGGGLISEPVCRQAFEHLFATEFPKTRQVLTSNVTGYRSANGNQVSLELDGYSEKLKIAFEYQGYSSHWDPSHPSFFETSKRDDLKKKICRRLGITLVCIPAFTDGKNKWDSQEIMAQVLTATKKFNLTPAQDPHLFSIDMSSIHQSLRQIKKLAKICQTHNGVLLSKEWKGVHFKYHFKDKSGVEFFKTAIDLKKHGWPKNFRALQNIVKTEKNKKLINKDFLTKRLAKRQAQIHLQEMVKRSHHYQGELLSTEWKGMRAKYRFKDKSGIEFFKTAESLRYQGWPKYLLEIRDPVYVKSIRPILDFDLTKQKF